MPEAFLARPSTKTAAVNLRIIELPHGRQPRAVLTTSQHNSDCIERKPTVSCVVQAAFVIFEGLQYVCLFSFPETKGGPAPLLRRTREAPSVHVYVCRPHPITRTITYFFVREAVGCGSRGTLSSSPARLERPWCDRCLARARSC